MGYLHILKVQSNSRHFLNTLHSDTKWKQALLLDSFNEHNILFNSHLSLCRYFQFAEILAFSY